MHSLTVFAHIRLFNWVICYLTLRFLNGTVILYTNNTPKSFCFSFTGALDLEIHIVFPFHCPSLLILPPNPITGMTCATERASFFLKIPLKVTCELIVNSGSLTVPLLIFIFKSPPGNYWTLVLLVFPIHTHTCASDLFIKVGVFKAAQQLFIINHSDARGSSLRRDREEPLHNYLISLF